ncbi:MAG TPA: putative O-glycosylation ligase, exosortase A system-associated [Acidobacteriaceae bacterium]|nr:putative O-glycosylation ligase, exosortase A system-associated [Acidobacteriaceae bacterium]
MLRGLFVVAAYLIMFGLGIGVPFILTLGYEWVDMFRPENILLGAFTAIPFSFLIGSAAIGFYFLSDRRDPPRIGAMIVITVLFAGWVTLTTTWAMVPGAAWAKWDWAFKSVLFSAFIPFVIRSRNQIEAFLQVFIFSLAADTIPAGAKTIVSGGGQYGPTLGLMHRNFWLGEGATLATAALMAIPIIFFLIKHQRIFPRNIWTKIGYLGLVPLSLATAIGTHERTALAGMLVLAGAVWLHSKRKILVAGLCIATGLVIIQIAPQSWMDRMATITHPSEDDSAVVRLQVWAWTLDFVRSHPQGGGFEVYRINQITLPGEDPDSPKTQDARAFHSAYFEVLGEHGWIGLGLFLSLLLLSLRSLRQVARLSRNLPHLAWCRDLSFALQNSLAVLAACGVFIGIAFQPLFYYMFPLSFILREYVRRVQSTPAVAAVEQPEGFALAR